MAPIQLKEVSVKDFRVKIMDHNLKPQQSIENRKAFPRAITFSNDSLKITASSALSTGNISNFPTQAEVPFQEKCKINTSAFVPAPKNPVSLLRSAEDLENEFITKRAAIVAADGFVSTPLHVMKSLAQEQEIHTEIFKLNFPKFPEKTIWRVEVFVGESFGIAQSLKRSLSLQLAAADLLGKVRVNFPVYELPAYGLLPGSRIRFTVHKDLMEFCQKNNLPKPVYEQVRVDEKTENHPKYVILCTVGNRRVIGRSDNNLFASRIAAKDMLELVSGKMYPNDMAKIGADCGNLEDLGTLSSVPAYSSGKQKWIDNYEGALKPMHSRLGSREVDEVEGDGDETEKDQWYDANSDFTED